jgi:hypothetical protein
MVYAGREEEIPDFVFLMCWHLYMEAQEKAVAKPTERKSSIFFCSRFFHGDWWWFIHLAGIIIYLRSEILAFPVTSMPPKLGKWTVSQCKKEIVNSWHTKKLSGFERLFVLWWWRFISSLLQHFLSKTWSMPSSTGWNSGCIHCIDR